jgi:hypothetical protein
MQFSITAVLFGLVAISSAAIADVEGVYNVARLPTALAASPTSLSSRMLALSTAPLASVCPVVPLPVSSKSLRRHKK